MSSHTRETGSLRWVGVSHRTLMAWRLLSAIMLLVMGGIHLYLVFDGVGGSLGVLFVLNAVGALVLAIAIVVLRGRLLSLATGLSLLFMVGTLLALVLGIGLVVFRCSVLGFAVRGRVERGFSLRTVRFGVRGVGVRNVGLDGRVISWRAVGNLVGQITCCRLLIFHWLPSR